MSGPAFLAGYAAALVVAAGLCLRARARGRREPPTSDPAAFHPVELAYLGDGANLATIVACVGLYQRGILVRSDRLADHNRVTHGDGHADIEPAGAAADSGNGRSESASRDGDGHHDRDGDSGTASAAANDGDGETGSAAASRASIERTMGTRGLALAAGTVFDAHPVEGAVAKAVGARMAIPTLWAALRAAPEMDDVRTGLVGAGLLHDRSTARDLRRGARWFGVVVVVGVVQLVRYVLVGGSEHAAALALVVVAAAGLGLASLVVGRRTRAGDRLVAAAVASVPLAGQREPADAGARRVAALGTAAVRSVEPTLAAVLGLGFARPSARRTDLSAVVSRGVERKAARRRRVRFRAADRGSCGVPGNAIDLGIVSHGGHDPGCGSSHGCGGDGGGCGGDGGGCGGGGGCGSS